MPTKAASDYLRQGWTQHASARDIHGTSLSRAASETAVCWCLTGATSIWSTRAMPGLGRFTSLDRVLDIVIQGVSSLQGAIQYNDAPDRTQDECITVMMEAEKRCGITSIFQLRGDPLFYEVCEQCLEPIKWEFFYDESGGYQTGACISHHIEYNRVDEIIVRAEE